MGNSNVNTSVTITAYDKATEVFRGIGQGGTDLSNQISGLTSKIGGLAAAVGVYSIANMVKQTIDAADSMNDLASKTGLTTEVLSKYKLLAEQNGSSTEGFANGMKHLSMTVSEHADYLDKMGIATKDSAGNTRSLDDVMKDIADKFVGYKDGADKAALAQTLFGKSGGEMIPMLNQGAAGFNKAEAEARKYGGILSGEFASASDALNDKLGLITMSAEGQARTFTGALMPSLNGVAQAMLDAKGNGESLNLVGKVLGKVMETLALGALGAYGAVVLTGQALAGFALIAGDLLTGTSGTEIAQHWAAIGDEMDATSAKLAKALMAIRNADKEPPSTANSAMDMKYQTIYQQLTNKAISLAQFEKAVQKLYMESGNAPNLKAAADADAAEQKRRNAEVQKNTELIAKLRGEYIALTTMTARELAIQKEMPALTKNATVEQVAQARALATARVDLADSNKLNAATLAETRKEWADFNKEQDASVAQNGKVISSLQDEYNQLFMTARERAIANEMTKLGTIADEDAAIAARTLAGAKYDATAAIAALTEQTKKQAEEFQRSADRMESSLTDALMRGFENGKGFIANFTDVLVNEFKTLTLRPMISAVMTPISAGLAGIMNPGTSIASSLSGDVSSGMNIAGMMGGLSAVGMGVQTTLAMAAESGLVSGITGGFTAGMSAVGAGGIQAGLGMMLPGIGLALAAGMLIASQLGGETRSGGAYAVDAGGNAVFQHGPSGGQIAASQVTGAISATPGAIEALLAKYGSGAQIANFVAGLESSGNGRGGAYAGGTVNGVAFGQTYDTRGMQSLTNEEAVTALGNELNASVLMALQAANLPSAAGKYFASLGEIKMPSNAAEVAQINAILGFAADGLLKLQDVAKIMPDMVDSMFTIAHGSLDQLNQFVTIAQYAATDPLKAAQDALRQSSMSLWDSYQQQGMAISQLASAYDGGINSTAQLASGLQSFGQTVGQVLQQIAAEKDSLHGMFASSGDSIRMSVMSNPQKYDFLRNQADELYAQLQAAIDPTKIATLAQQINDKINAAYSTLDQTQQQGASGGFVDYLSQVDELTTQRLNESQNAIVQQHADLASTIEAGMGAAADKFFAAAAAMQSAANTPVRVDANVHFTANVPGNTELMPG